MATLAQTEWRGRRYTLKRQFELLGELWTELERLKRGAHTDF